MSCRLSALVDLVFPIGSALQHAELLIKESKVILFLQFLVLLVLLVVSIPVAYFKANLDTSFSSFCLASLYLHLLQINVLKPTGWLCCEWNFVRTSLMIPILDSLIKTFKINSLMFLNICWTCKILGWNSWYWHFKIYSQIMYFIKSYILCIYTIYTKYCINILFLIKLLYTLLCIYKSKLLVHTSILHFCHQLVCLCSICGWHAYCVT